MEDNKIIAAIIATGIIAKSKRVAGKLPKVAKAATEVYFETLKCLGEAESQRSTGPRESMKQTSEKAKKKPQGALVK